MTRPVNNDIGQSRQQKEPAITNKTINVSITDTPAVREPSYVTFLLDRSGSMESIKSATFEAFNAYLDGLSDAPGDLKFSLLQFNGGGVDKTCTMVSPKDAPRLNNRNYHPSLGTPLIDAAFKTIRAMEVFVAERHSDAKPKVVICIQTDGEENCSTEHTWDDLKALVSRKTEEGWQFNFMGAGINAYHQGTKMGIHTVNTVSYNSRDLGATRSVFAASASNTASFSAGVRADTSYTSQQRDDAGDVYWGGGMPTPAMPSVDLNINLGGSIASAAPPTAVKSNGPRKVVPDITL